MPKHTHTPNDWRCTHCQMLLGRRDGDRVHVRFARGHQYVASLPITSVCRSCATLNELGAIR